MGYTLKQRVVVWEDTAFSTNVTPKNFQMKYLPALAFLSLVIITSCTQKCNDQLKYSIRDTVLKQHLAELDSLPYYDTTDINYKVLKAYQNNDTTFFKNLIVQIKKQKEYSHYGSLMDDCIHQPELNDLGADEAYRFIFLSAFCIEPINVTVTKKGDSANLHFLLYQGQYDTIPCKIESEYDKKLTSAQWEEFSNKLFQADIWGLKRDNGMHGVDGSSITFIGYVKGNPSFNRPDKFCYVSRWEFSTLHDALTLLLKISGNKKGCYWVQ
ncbi:hypothetical protein [Ferruginibacter sp.]